MNEKRLVNRLTKYWERLKGERDFPEFERLNSAAISDVWERCLVLEIENSSSSATSIYKYTHMGREVVAVYGTDLVGHNVNIHMHNFPGWQVLKSVDKLVGSPEVQTGMGSFINGDDRMVKYRACAMPFGRGEKITHALVGLSWRAF